MCVCKSLLFLRTQTKDTLWEGGTRGAGLLWSPSLESAPRVSEQMMNVQDWLPTLYTAAGILQGKNDFRLLWS